MTLSARNLDRSTELAARLEVAATVWSRFRGLMGRPTLDEGAGLWLTGNGIHMMFMRFQIDAVFLGAAEAGAASPGGATAEGPRPVLSVHPGLRTWIGIVPLVRGAAGVLELPVGTIARSGTVVGDRIVLETVQPA